MMMHQLTNKQYEEYQRLCYARDHGYILTPDNLRFICEAHDKDPERIGEQILQIVGKMQNDRIAHMTSDKRNKYVIRCPSQRRNRAIKGLLVRGHLCAKGNGAAGKRHHRETGAACLYR